jgi:hypothetical protein
MIQTAGKCVGPKGVGVEVMADGSFVTAAGGLAEVDDVEYAVVAVVEEVVADAVAVDYRHS